MFHLNFYIGILLMGGTLLLYVRKTDSSITFTVTALLLLAFYEGKGSYHGFFWVVPSFYAVMLFLLAAVALFNSRHHYRYGLPLVLLLLLTHSTGIYHVAVLAMALVINNMLFNRNPEGLKTTLLLAAIGLIVVVVSEFLYAQGILAKSFLSILKAHSSINATDSATLWSGTAKPLLLNMLEPFTRHDFTKYFAGIYTPVVGYGIYQTYRSRKLPLLSLFIVLLIGQILVAGVAIKNYRFFYPLEVVTWIVMAFGIARALEHLFGNNKTRSNLGRVGLGLLLALSTLFLYGAIHQKAEHSWYFKFYGPRFFQKEAFLDYIQEHPDKQLAVYTNHDGNYLGLPGARKSLHFTFSPKGSTITDTPHNWLVIAENHKLFSEKQQGFHLVVPHNATLELNASALSPGKYRLELTDSHLKSIDGISLTFEFDKKHKSEWHEEPYAVRFPEEEMYPPLLMPWYWNGDTPWPLHKKPLHRMGTVRESSRFWVEFELKNPETTIQLQNTGADRYLLGEIALINLDTNTRHAFDLYWGDETVLKNNMALILNGKEHPLLWTDPVNGPGMTRSMFSASS